MREEMARIYQDKLSYFWPIIITPDPFYAKSRDAMSEHEFLGEKGISQQRKVEKALMKRGYTRLQEKLKEIRQKFSEAVTSGREVAVVKLFWSFMISWCRFGVVPQLQNLCLLVYVLEILTA